MVKQCYLTYSKYSIGSTENVISKRHNLTFKSLLAVVQPTNKHLSCFVKMTKQCQYSCDIIVNRSTTYVYTE